MKFTQIPVDTFKNIQLNAGIIVDDFNPATGVVGNLLGATTGGVNFTDTVNYTDFGEDIDNCPKNTMELKKLDSHEVKMAGTFVTVTAGVAKMLVGVGYVDTENAGHIIPRNEVLTTDFTSLWWIGDYSDENTGDNAGFIAIKLFNALNTGGFQIQSTDKGKGQFAFEFTGHYSISAQDVVPYELYVQAGSAEVIPSITLAKHTITIAEGETYNLSYTATPTVGILIDSNMADTSVATAEVVEEGGTSTNAFTITGVAEGNTIFTVTLTVGGVAYTDTCTVIVTGTEE